MNKIQDKALLVSLNISQWTARKYDKAATAQVAEHYKTPETAGRYNKVLIAQDQLREITKIANEMRTYHYEVTLPYRAAGSSILATAIMPEYMAKSSELSARFHTAVKAFMDAYPDLRAQARITLNGLYRDEDYPSMRELAKKFNFNVDFYPIPEGSHLRINIDADDLREIQQDIEDKVRDSMKVAMDDLWRRLYGVTAAMKDRLTLDSNGSQKIFRDSMIGNIRALAELLPKLNFTDDPDLAMVAAELGAGLGQYEPDELRENDDVRKEALAKANGILKKIGQLRGGNAPADEPEPDPVAPEPDPEPVKEPEAESMADKLRKAGVI